MVVRLPVDRGPGRRSLVILAVLACARPLTAVRRAQGASDQPGFSPPQLEDFQPDEDASMEPMRERMLGTWEEEDPRHESFSFEFVALPGGEALSCKAATPDRFDALTDGVMLKPQLGHSDGLLRFEGLGPAPWIHDHPPASEKAEYRFWLNKAGELRGDVMWQDPRTGFVTKNFCGVRSDPKIDARARLLGWWQETRPVHAQDHPAYERIRYAFHATGDSHLRCQASGYEPHGNDFIGSVLLRSKRVPSPDLVGLIYTGVGEAKWSRDGKVVEARYDFWVEKDGNLHGEMQWLENHTLMGKSISAHRLAH